MWFLNFITSFFSIIFCSSITLKEDVIYVVLTRGRAHLHSRNFSHLRTNHITLCLQQKGIIVSKKKGTSKKIIKNNCVEDIFLFLWNLIEINVKEENLLYVIDWFNAKKFCTKCYKLMMSTL